jgi:hypothetical protein
MFIYWLRYYSMEIRIATRSIACKTSYVSKAISRKDAKQNERTIPTLQAYGAALYNPKVASRRIGVVG